MIRLLHAPVLRRWCGQVHPSPEERDDNNARAVPRRHPCNIVARVFQRFQPLRDRSAGGSNLRGRSNLVKSKGSGVVVSPLLVHAAFRVAAGWTPGPAAWSNLRGRESLCHLFSNTRPSAWPQAGLQAQPPGGQGTPSVVAVGCRAPPTAAAPPAPSASAARSPTSAHPPGPPPATSPAPSATAAAAGRSPLPGAARRRCTRATPRPALPGLPAPRCAPRSGRR